jgi:hypothetical protein
MMKHLLIVAALLAVFQQARSQGGDVSEEPLAMSLFQFSGGFHVPFGDMADMYGMNAFAGISYAYKTKSNFLIGADFTYIFGNNVKDADDLLSEHRTSDGQIVGPEGEYINILILQRGFAAGFYVGKIWPIFGPNPNSGLVAKFGVNYLEHRTWIETRENTMPHLEGEYRKGYDRKRGGIATYQFIGYQHFSNSRYANFFAGIDIYQGFMTDYRTYNYDQRAYTNGNYFDILLGFRAGWVIPIYKQVNRDFYFN